MKANIKEFITTDLNELRMNKRGIMQAKVTATSPNSKTSSNGSKMQWKMMQYDWQT